MKHKFNRFQSGDDKGVRQANVTIDDRYFLRTP